MKDNALNSKADVEPQDTNGKETKPDRYDIVLPQPIIESFARFLVSELRYYYDDYAANTTLARPQRGKKL